MFLSLSLGTQQQISSVSSGGRRGKPERERRHTNRGRRKPEGRGLQRRSFSGQPKFSKNNLSAAIQKKEKKSQTRSITPPHTKHFGSKHNNKRMNEQVYSMSTRHILCILCRQGPREAGERSPCSSNSQCLISLVSS